MLGPLLLALALSAAPARVENNELKLDSAVTFATGRAELSPDSDAALTQVKEFLEAKTYITLMRVEVHTDTTGDAAANQALSEKRAVAVVEALVKKGIDCKRLLAVGFGGTKPVAANDTPDGRAQNRRVTFAMAALKGRPIGGMPVDGGGKPLDACATP